jgi:hypothetical protein
MMSHPQRVRVDCTEIYGIIAGTPGCRQSAQLPPGSNTPPMATGTGVASPSEGSS